MVFPHVIQALYTGRDRERQIPPSVVKLTSVPSPYSIISNSRFNVFISNFHTIIANTSITHVCEKVHTFISHFIMCLLG